ncbi:MAG: phytanoyl-CoA dioxygenase family protein, partial [Pseudomonadota bacterium]
CTVWAPVDKVTADSGPLRYIPKSHKWNKSYRPNIFISQMPFPGGYGEEMPDFESNEAELEPVSYDLDPGDIMVHDFRVVHGSGGNLSDRPRRAATFVYVGDDVRYKLHPGAPAQPSHPKMEDGQELDPNFYPVVWRESKTKTVRARQLEDA